MAKPWAQVAASPQYQALPPEQREAARRQYFDQVVAPQIGDPSQVESARAQFDAQTGANASNPANNSDFARLITGKQAPEAAPDPTEGMSTLDKVRAGMGKAFADTGAGIKQSVTDGARHYTRAMRGIAEHSPLDLSRQIANG